MNPAQIERVFGRSRLKMTTGEHVEVFREAVAPGERRRYTKRFLATSDGDFGQWTEREWRILARLIGHGVRCVPDVVQFDGGAMGGIRLVQTYDAGVTADQWATLLPVSRDGAARRHVFEDCAHWWALAHYCLTALDEIHSLRTGAPRHQRRQHLHSLRADELRSGCDWALLSDFPETGIHRFRVLAGFSGEPVHATADRLAERLRLPVASTAQSARCRAQWRSAADERARLALRYVQPRGDAQALPAERGTGRRHGMDTTAVTTTRGHSFSGFASATMGTLTGDRINS